MAKGTRGFSIKGIDMTGYMVKDTERALGFYRDVLGLEPAMLYPDEMGAEYELGDGTTFGLFNGGERVPWRPGNGIMFAVDDFDAAVRHAKASGAHVQMEHETPVCFMALVEDTEGNQFMIHKRKVTA